MKQITKELMVYEPGDVILLKTGKVMIIKVHKMPESDNFWYECMDYTGYPFSLKQGALLEHGEYVGQADISILGLEADYIFPEEAEPIEPDPEEPIEDEPEEPEDENTENPENSDENESDSDENEPENTENEQKDPFEEIEDILNEADKL